MKLNYKWLCVGLFAVVVLALPVYAQRRRDSGPDMTVDAAAKADVIRALAKGMRDNYVFPDTGEKVAVMLEERQAKQEYDTVTSARSFAELLTKQILDVAHDKHLRVNYSSEVLPPMPTGPIPAMRPEGTPSPVPGPPPEMLAQLRRRNYEFERVEVLPGNLGYLKFNGFMMATPEARAAAGAAMAFVANTDALIIDLRENGGGRPEMIAFLAAYLFVDGPVHLSDIRNRKAGTREYTVTENWTVKDVPGPKYLNKEVYVLIGPGTFSAAEAFTYDLQSLKRATVVGETSGGGANPGGPFRLSDHFSAFMPRGHSVNPITKTNWEGKGITPDVATVEADALRTARAAALKNLIAKTTDQRVLTELKQALADLELKPAAARP